MSDRDELDSRTSGLADLCVAEVERLMPNFQHAGDLGDRIAVVLWAAGWRKMPSREQVAFTIYDLMGGDVELGYPFMPDQNVRHGAETVADAILALMDGGSDER